MKRLLWLFLITVGFNLSGDPVPPPAHSPSAGIEHPFWRYLSEWSAAIQTDSPPSVVVLHYGRKGGDSAITQYSETRRLEACGFPVVEWDDVPAEGLKAAAQQSQLKGKPLFLINAHGTEKKEEKDKEFSLQNGYEVGSALSPLKFFDGNKLVAQLHELYPHSSVWGGTCHAGACSPGTCAWGAECQFDEPAWSDLQAWDDIARFLCDGFNGDCQLWNQWDRNHDGELSAEELNRFLFREAKVVETNSTLRAPTLAALKITIEEFSNHCKHKAQGETSTQGSPQHRWEVVASRVMVQGQRQFWAYVPKDKPDQGVIVRGADFSEENAGPGTQWQIKKIPLPDQTSVHDEKAVLSAISKRFPQWPQGCGSEGLEAFHDCELKDNQIEQKVSCKRKGGGYRSTEAFQPQSFGFKLKSRRCQQIYRKWSQNSEARKKKGSP